MKNPCQHEHLASSMLTNAFVCYECQLVHWRMQNMSWHFKLNDFLEIADTLSVAANKLRADSQATKQKKSHFLTVVKNPSHRLN